MIVRGKTESSLVANKDILLELITEEINIREQNAGQNHSINIANKSFVKVTELRYLGEILVIANRNDILKENHSRLSSGNACYH